MKWISDISDARLEIILGFLFGFTILLVYGILAVCIGMGNVKEDTSFGLQYVLQGLAALGGGFTGWFAARYRHEGRNGNDNIRRDSTDTGRDGTTGS